MNSSRRMTTKVPPLRWFNIGGRFLTGGWITVCLINCGQPTVEVNLPGPEDGLHYVSPAEVWDEALPLGNGIMGALVWGDGNPLKISLDRSDLWDLRKVPEFYSEEYTFELMRQWHLEEKTADLIRLYEDPYHRPAPTRIPAGRIELDLGPEQAFTNADLALIDAAATITLTGLNVQVLVHAEEPVGMIRIDSDTSPSVGLLPPPFAGKVENRAQGGIGAGDLAQLGYSAPVQTAGDNWKAYYQEGAEGFRFAVFVGWRDDQTDWKAVWSVASSFESEDPLTLAKQRVFRTLEVFDDTRITHSAWWNRYWRSSSVRLPNPVLERQWFLDQYKFGSAARRWAPPISLQAVWTADDGKLPPWKGDYHHDLNTQLSYWPCYTGNHLDEGLGYLDWLWDTRDTAFDWTERFFQLPGLNVPMTADLEGRQIGGWRQYTHSATTAAWLAQHFYLHWKFSADREFLETRAYPYLKDASTFLEAFTKPRNAGGLRSFPLSASPEINDNRPEAWFSQATNYDLALTRWLFQATSELGEELGLTTEAANWRKILSELPQLASDEETGLLVAPSYPLDTSHRHFSHLMAIHPLGLIDQSQGPGAEEIVKASLRHLEALGSDWWTGYSFSWYANLLAWAGEGEKAEKALETFSTAFTLRNSFHCNGDQSGQGYSRYTYRPFTLEGNFAAAAGTQEMLLQSHRGVVEVFPAVPDSWSDISFTTLRSQGAFLISAVRSGGKTTLVNVLSEKGGTLRLASPFTGKEETIETYPGQTIVLMP